MEYYILVYEGDNLFALTGPFNNKEEARRWILLRNDKGKYEIVPLWKPNSVEKLD